MTDPKLMREASALRERLGAEGLVLVSWSAGSYHNVTVAADGCNAEQCAQADDLTDLLLYEVIPQFLLKRNLGKPTKRTKAAEAKRANEG